ncbi:hypothetical protein WAB17_04720 [Parerythrobacter aurantius]|uniref:hypothetical protein n=1 Tax=Parerythrobacter aurantius TaxID=3127706 RepID=UPI0032478912
MLFARLVVLAVCTAILPGCSGPEQALPATSNDAPAQSGSIIEPWTMEGSYTVAFINHREPAPRGDWPAMRVTIGPDRIVWTSQCVGAQWTYRGSDEDYRTERYYEAGTGMCARGLTQEEQQVERAFDELELILRVEGGVYVEGGGEKVQLRLVPSEAQRSARAVDLSGEWRVAGIDGKPIDQSYGLAIRADFRNVWWEPGCAGQGRDYAIVGNRFETLPPPPGPATVCAIGYPPEVPQIWQAMDAADTIARTPENGVLISGGGRSVLLFSQ